MALGIRDRLDDPPGRIADQAERDGREQDATEGLVEQLQHGPVLIGARFAAPTEGRTRREETHRDVEQCLRDEPDARESLDPRRDLLLGVVDRYGNRRERHAST